MRIECHLIGGLFGFLPFISAGTRKAEKALDDLLGDLPPEAFDGARQAHHHNHGEWEKVLKGIIDRYRISGVKPLVILIGHSYGALRCQQIAVALEKEGFPVAYVAGIDPTALMPWQAPMAIPHNVARVDQFWAAMGVPASARARGSNGGQYLFPKGWKGEAWVKAYPAGHIELASRQSVRDRIVEQVGRLVI